MPCRSAGCLPTTRERKEGLSTSAVQRTVSSMEQRRSVLARNTVRQPATHAQRLTIVTIQAMGCVACDGYLTDGPIEPIRRASTIWIRRSGL